MNLLPIFVKLEGRRCLLVGAGHVALDKARSLLAAGARLRVIAPQALPAIEELAQSGQLEWTQREFAPADLDGNQLAIAATNEAEVNAAVHREAAARGILSNSVDDIPNCDFFFGSVVKRGPLQVAISTGGESPAFAQRLRREMDAALPEELGSWLENLGELRREVLATQPRGEARKALLHRLAHAPVCASSDCPSRRRALEPLDRKVREVGGKVYLVGAGPGDPDLLTVKALRLIQTAGVVLHDDLVPEAILQLAAPQAEVVNVGKRCGVKTITQEKINELMIERARAQRTVVRLKSGDPLIFGRAAEEIAALSEAGVAYEVVPGITAAFAAAAAIGRSLTDRNCASSVLFSTGHHARSHQRPGGPAIEEATRVVYMPGRDLRMLAAQWLDEGLLPELPCVVVSRAAQPDEQVILTTLEALGEMEPAPAPSILIAGWAVADRTAAGAPDADALAALA